MVFEGSTADLTIVPHLYDKCCIYLRRIFEEEGWARGVKKTPEEVCRDHAGGPHENGNLTRQAICWEVSQMGY